jgi:hypothetical protein
VIVGIATGAIGGLLIILLAAPLSSNTNYSKRVSNWYLTTAMATMDRPAFVVSPTTDISLESRSVNQRFNREELPGDPATLLRLTRNSTLRCGKRAITFVDEQFGVSFDLRDVAVFEKLTTLDHDGNLATTHEQQNQYGDVVGLTAFERAVCRIDDAGPSSLSMNLDSNVRAWCDGNEDATAWHRTWKAVERMFSMHGSALSWLKSLVPVLALIAGLFAAYYLIGPGSLPGAPSSRDIGVGAGSLLLLGLFGDSDDAEPESDDVDDNAESDVDDALQIDNRILAGVAGALIACTTLLILALTAPSAIGTLAIAAATSVVVFGAVWIGSTAIISSLPRAIRDPIGNLWLTLALNGLDDPILYQTASGTLELRESSDIGLDGSGPRYRVGTNLVGFAVDRSVDSFDGAGIRGSKLGTLRDDAPAGSITDVAAVSDGGQVESLPADYELTTSIQNGGVHGVVPSYDAMDSDKRSGTYVRTDKWMSRMADAATGKISERAQLEATKEFADGESGFSDQQLMYLSLGAAIAGFIGGAGLWAVLL